MNVSPCVLTELIARADRLYTLPTVAAQVLELCQHPRVDSHALKRCIERDPALTARLLKTVNSSLFGVRQPVTDLNQALSLLGTKAVKMLVLSFNLPDELFAGHELETLSRYWRHTLIKAVAARELAEQIWQRSGDDAFLAGLLQDIGELVLLQQLGEPYRRFVNHVAEQGGDLLALEAQSLGFDHSVISARLLRKWGLPETLVEAVGTPFVATNIAVPDANVSLPEILRLAELLARLFTQHQPYALREVLEMGERCQRLNYDQLQNLVAQLDAKVAELGDAFALYPQGGPTLVDLLAQANAQLSELAFDLYDDVSRLAEELQAAVRQSSLSEPPHKAVVRHAEPAASGESVRYDRARPTQRQPVISCLDRKDTDDPGLVGRIAAAIVSGRQQHRPVTLVLFEIDRYSDWVFALGPERAAAGQRLLQAAAMQLSPQGGKCQAIGEARYALLWDCDRREAAQSGRLLAQAIEQWWEQRQEAAALTVSLGIATLAFPSKNFPPRELLVPAERCLSAAIMSGGNCVKSIEV